MRDQAPPGAPPSAWATRLSAPPPLTLTRPITSPAVEWWATAVAALSGVVVGTGLKYVADRLTEGQRRAVEDARRFIDQRREAYAEFQTAADAFRSAFLTFAHEDGGIDIRNATLRQAQASGTGVADAQAEVETQGARAAAAREVERAERARLWRVINGLRLIAPAEVVAAAEVCEAAAHNHPDRKVDYFDSLAGFIRVCRADLHADG